MDSPAPLPDTVRDAIARGDKLGAVKALREATGLGLAEALRVVETAIENPAAVRLPAPRAAAELEDEIVAALRRGQKIEAIRLTRERHGLSLKEAKDRVEAAEAQGRGAAQRPSGLAPGEQPRRGMGAWVAPAVVAAAVAAWFLFA